MRNIFFAVVIIWWIGGLGGFARALPLKYDDVEPTATPGYHIERDETIVVQSKPLMTANQLFFQVSPDKKRLLQEQRKQLRAKILDRFQRLYEREKRLGRKVKRGEPMVISPPSSTP